MAFDAWSGIVTLGGAGALSYLAAGQVNKEQGDKPTLRLSLDKGGSLLGDVRLLGGALSAGASYYLASGDTKKVLSGVALASFASLICTELVRYRFAKFTKEGKSTQIAEAKILPAVFSQYGALPGPAGVYGANYQAQNAWAAR